MERFAINGRHGTRHTVAIVSDIDESAKTINRRAVIAGIGGMGIFTLLAARLYNLQVLNSQDYQVLSENNRFNFAITLPERGRIFDRFGVPLAINQQDFRLVMIPERVGDLDVTFNQIDKIVPLSVDKRKRIVADIKRSPSFVPVMVADHLNWDEFSELNFNLPEISGVVPMEATKRFYPFDGVFAHIIGYVGSASPKDVEKDDDPLLRQPTFRVGKSGIEQSQDKSLRGKAGRKKVEVNAFGRVVREWDDEKIPAEPGEDIWLTLDAELQRQTAADFLEDSGGAALMDVHTGELRVLLSMPSFDNNLFVSGLTPSEMRALNTDPRRPQFNKVIGGAYPPASTFKMAVGLAALRHNIVKPTDRVFCAGKIHVGNRDFHCHKRQGHGLMNMYDAIKYSCDVYFYEIIQVLGMAKVKPVCEELGLGQTYDLGLTGQAKGVIPDADWKQQNLGSAWRTGDELNAAIGQGFDLATPLQLAVMCTRLANGHKKVLPNLIAKRDLVPPDPMMIDTEHMAFIQAAMNGVVNEPGGTAYAPRGLGIKGVKMAGKTGTGQVRGISTSERLERVRKDKELPWKLRDHKLFVGYAPVEKPRFAGAVVVEHSGADPKRAINIFTNMLSTALKTDGFGEIEPTGDGL